MRTSLITSAIAASVLTVGFAAGAVQAGNREPAAPPTTLPGGDMLAGLGLTPEQTQCLMDSATSVDMNDPAAVMGLMTECGIDPMELVAGGATPTEPVVETETTGATETTATTATTGDGAAVGPAVAASVMLMLGVDPASAQCIEDGLQAAQSPGNDNEALLILQQCGLTLNDLLLGLLAVNDIAAGSGGITSSTVAGPPTTALAGPPTTTAAGSSGNALVDQIQQLVREQYGVELTDEQVNCLLDNNIADLDPNDMAGALALMETCEISITDLAG